MQLTSTQTALVTGASSGIGKALAKQFARHGYSVIAVSENGDELDAAAQEIALDTNGVITTMRKDLTEVKAAQELYDEVNARGITVDVLVNDAGIGQRGLFHEVDIEKHVRIIRLNIEALTRLTSLFLKDMVERDSGSILNVGSIAGFEPGPLFATYNASKAYVNSLSEALAEELKDTNVTVTALCPGPVHTDFFSKADAERIRVLYTGIVMEPDEVAEAAYEALMSGERMIIPGVANKALVFSRRVMPKALQAKINKKLYEVNGEE